MNKENTTVFMVIIVGVILLYLLFVGCSTFAASTQENNRCVAQHGYWKPNTWLLGTTGKCIK